MTPAENIIEKLGGVRPLAKKLKHKHPTTVQGWKNRGVIPMRQIPVVIRIALADEIEISLDDFFPAEPAARKRAPKKN